MRDRKDLAEGLPVGPVSSARVEELEKENDILKEKLDAHCKHFDEVRADRDKLEGMWLKEKDYRKQLEGNLRVAEAQLRVVNLIFGGKNGPYI